VTALGFSAEQFKSFIPPVLDFLKGRLAADALKQLSGLLPVGEEAAVGTNACNLARPQRPRRFQHLYFHPFRRDPQ
jgi:hypothetical protein